MDPNNPIPSNHDQYEVKPAYIKQLIDDDVERPEFDMDFLHNKNSVCGRMARNGKHRGDDDDEYDYTDIGPETDVDAGEDVHNKYPALAASSSLDPSPESEKSPMVQSIEKHNDDNRNDNDYSNRDNANVCPVDSTIDDGDVDNRVRPSDRDVRVADDETLRDDDDARIGTAATHTVVDDESPPSPRAAKPLQDVLIVAENVADSEDSEDEWNYYRVEPNKQESAAIAVTVEESLRNVEEQKAQENFESVAKDSPEVQSLEAKSDIKCDILARDTSTPELIDIDISEERKLSESKKNNQLFLDLQEAKKEQDMDFQLNPEAAEFVPLSPPLAKNYLRDFAISGSPLKQTQPMDDIPVPSQSEFDKEVCYRPKEIGEDFSHDGHIDLQNNSSQNMDVSDISSTKAEVGDDEAMMHVMSTSQWQADISSQWNEKTCDDAGSDLDESDIVTKDNPMAMSLTPGGFKAAFEKDIDLNAVHMLDDSSDGAEQVSTPPRSPKPYTNEERSRTPLSENTNATEDLSTSQLLGDSIPTVNSESTERTSSLSATMHEDEGSSIDRYQLQSMMSHSILSPAAKKVFQNDDSEDDTNYEKQFQSVQENERFVQEDSNTDKENEKSSKNEEDNDKKESMESEELKNLPDSTNHSNFNDAIFGSEQQSLLSETEKRCRPETPSDAKHIHYGDSFNAEIIPDDIADPFKFTMESPQLMNLRTEQNILPQSLLSEETQPETTSVVEQTHYGANFKPEVIPGIIDPFKITMESTQLTTSDWTDFYKTMLPQNPTATFERNIEFEDGEEDKQQKEAEKYNKIKDDSNENIKPDSTTELNLSDSQKSNFVENELQHKDQVFLGYVPETVKLIDNSFEQEHAEKKAADVPPINIEVFEKEVTSESALPKQEEPQKTAEANDTATIDKSKELPGVTKASVEAAVIATATAMVIKTKTTNAKRPTKTTTTKATTASTRTAAKSITPTSPSKAISATMRTTTTTSPAQPTAKRPVTSTVTRSKQLDGSAKAAVSSASSKNTKTTVTTKVATTATRTSSSPRVSSSTRPKTTTTTTSKVSNGTSIEKKSAMSADTKSINKPTQTKSASSTSRTTTTSTTAKNTLVKTSTTTKTSVPNVTLKARPASATSATKTTTSKQSTTVTNSSRPKTAPTSGGTLKPRESGKITAITGKSPLIDKQSKETVNKQISRSGASAPKPSARTSAPIGTATSAIKPRTPSGKSIGNASATSPTKKPMTTSSKTASRTSSTATKRISSSETKVLQNGIPKEDVTNAPVITATSKPEDDVPRKDTSPVNVPTDNQLIAD